MYILLFFMSGFCRITIILADDIKKVYTVPKIIDENDGEKFIQDIVHDNSTYNMK